MAAPVVVDNTIEDFQCVHRTREGSSWHRWDICIGPLKTPWEVCSLCGEARRMTPTPELTERG